jgi:predicted MPP superfamily phosphohydrolase
MDGRVRWLHCSDFHLGKEDYAQCRLLEKIVEHVRSVMASGFVPDLVFVTGDLANKGKNAEYASFRNEFFLPLKEALGGARWDGRVLVVPGNHDLDRTQNDTFDQGQAVAAGSQFFDPTKAGQSKRQILAPRFKAFRQKGTADGSNDWISATDGGFAEVIEVRGCRIGVAGINTAWRS